MLMAVLVGWACGACAPRSNLASGAGASGLVGSLEVEVVRDTALLTLHATNGGTAPVTLHFRSAQRYDFQVRTLAGESLWTWSADRSFAQVEGTEVVPPGGTLRERVAWPVSVPAGEYVAVARLESAYPLELSARFRVPVE
jgi:hypothetical protein